MRIVVFALAAMLTVAGCSTPNQAPAAAVTAAHRFEAPAQGMGRVYVWRRAYPPRRMTFTIDDQSVVLGIDAFAFFDVPAGVHELVGSYGELALQITVEAGRSYFVDATWHMREPHLASEERGRRSVLELRKMGTPTSAP